MNSWPLVVAYGGGANSTALLIEMVNRNVVPDLIIFSDTGGELPETYQFVSDFSEWLVSKKFPKINIVRYERETLEQDCLRKNMLPSIAYGFKTCSHKYKIQPMDKFCNNWQPAKDVWKKGGKIIKLIGYDAGEHHRAKIPEDKKYIYQYPLVDWGWGRKKCLEIVKSIGFTPRKSACFFCPSSKKYEILNLSKTHPDLMARAIKMEKNAICRVVKGLGRNWKWEDLLNRDKMQLNMFSDFDDLPDPIPCGCYDGGFEDLNLSPQETKKEGK